MFEIGSKVFVFFNPRDMQQPEENHVVEAVTEKCQIQGARVK